MKKCPKCGNASYDGAPVCGNCGYNFPKPKVVAPKSEDIFKEEPKKEKTSNEESTANILKQHKGTIIAILIITLIVICGIFLLSGNNSNNNSNNTPIKLNDLVTYKEGTFSFEYPKDWKKINKTDSEHLGAKFFKNKNGAIIEYYNISNDSDSLKDITQNRINYAQENGAYVELVETITLDGRNSSNILLENGDGNYTRFVSMFSDGELYVFKITGDSINTVTSEDIESTISSADIA